MASLPNYSHTYQHLRARKIRTKSGCLTCRRRRKKCDEIRPSCSSCVKSQVHCDWPSFHVIEASATSTRDFFRAQKPRKPKKSSSIASRSQSGTSSFDNGGRLECKGHIFGVVPAEVTTLYSKDQGVSWQLLEFFVLEGSKGMSGRVPSNDPFVRLVLQLSQSDELVWSAVLAFSGSRMSVVCSLPTVEYATLHHYNDTLVQLQAALGHWPPNTGEEVIRLLSTSILLCHEEVCQIRMMSFCCVCS